MQFNERRLLRFGDQRQDNPEASRRCLRVRLPVSAASAQSGGGAPPSQPIQLPLSVRQQGGTSVQQSVQIPSGASTAIQVQTQYPYWKFADAIEPGRVSLSLAEAVERGLHTNLGLTSASNGELQARAQRNMARSALLPHLTASASETAAKVNLGAEGFSAGAFGGSIPFQFPTTVGPFHYYDLHGALQQSILDVTAMRNLRVQGAALEGAHQQALQAVRKSCLR